MYRTRPFNRSTRRRSPSDELHPAVLAGDADKGRHLLALGADVEARDSQGLTPLMTAASKGKEDCARLLIAAGADCNAKEPGGDTALLMAAQEDETACALLLIENGARIDEKGADGVTPLLATMGQGYVNTALVLIEKGADVDEQSDEGNPALVIAAASDNAALNAVAIALINKGAQLDVTGPAGTTPLICAAWGANTSLVKYLADKGADLDFRSQGRTALDIAESEGYSQTVDVLKTAYVTRKRQQEEAIQSSADGFRNGLSASITAGRPLSFKPKV